MKNEYKFKSGDLVTPKLTYKQSRAGSTEARKNTQNRVAVVLDAIPDLDASLTRYKLKWSDPNLDKEFPEMFEKELKHASGDPNGRRRIPIGGSGDLIIEYSSNNSGGSWWLDDGDWDKLEKAGWQVDWYSDPEVRLSGGGIGMGRNSDRFLGAVATTARKRFNKMGEGIRDWEEATNADSTDCGCSCCGAPHNFSSENEKTGAHDYWTTERPRNGSRYDD